MAGSEDLCGCCDGIGAETPAEVWNRPGLPAVAYRVGEHGSFKASMLARLSSTAYPALNGLTTRDDSDLSIALLDAAATVGEILTFYQERIANESYLATATRWRALASMGRLTGYEPRAGLAATAALAFTLDDAAGAPEETDIPAGTRVQSIPAAGAMPQAFETSAVFTGRPEWNGMRPVTMQAQPTPTASTQSLTVQGLATGVRRGDLLLITTGSTPVVRQVLAATPDQPTGTTRLDLSGSPEPPPTYVPPPLPILRIFDFEETLLTNSEMRRSVLGYRWAQPDLRAFATTKRWSVPQLRRAAAALAAPTPPPAGIFRFRQTGAIFGHNAPRADQLTSTPNPPSLDDWDAGVQDYPGSRVNELWEGLHKLPARSRTIQLDRVYDGVVREAGRSWLNSTL